MKKEESIDGVIVTMDDGDESTAHITEICGKELNDIEDARRLRFIKSHAASFGYKVVDKDGKEV